MEFVFLAGFLLACRVLTGILLLLLPTDPTEEANDTAEGGLADIDFGMIEKIEVFQ